METVFEAITSLFCGGLAFAFVYLAAKSGPDLVAALAALVVASWYWCHTADGRRRRDLTKMVEDAKRVRRSQEP